MLDLRQYLPAKRKATSSGWISVNAPCCVHNGESADKRSRGGLKISDKGWSWHCFNCGYTASFTVGRALSYKARKLLSWLNVPPEDIERINLESLKQKNILGILDDRQRAVEPVRSVSFQEKQLPENFVAIDSSMPEYYQYILNRGVPLDYPVGVIVSNDGKASRPGVIIPFTHKGKLVGHSTRFLDDRNPRYIHDTQPGYVFGTDLQHNSWQYALVFEGIFDALSLSGLAVMHADINQQQAELVRSLGKEIIVVPDQDTAGMKLVDRAVELGWAVSMPEWPECKDVNDAVQKYGRLATLLSIMQYKETSRIKIELRRKQVAKKFQ